MEMEHINENVIKVLINGADLEERGIDFLDLIGDQGRIESFFYSILEEVDIDRDFKESETITFQVIPTERGLELYISRSSFEDMENFWAEEIKRRLAERDKAPEPVIEEDATSNKPINPKALEIIEGIVEKAQAELQAQTEAEAAEQEETTEEDAGPEVIAFSQLEDFLKLARVLPTCNFQASLYHMNEKYYLLLGEIAEGVDEEVAYGEFVSMLEFGEAQGTTQAVLEEYGQLIRAGDALVFFGEQF